MIVASVLVLLSLAGNVVQYAMYAQRGRDLAAARADLVFALQAREADETAQRMLRQKQQEALKNERATLDELARAAREAADEPDDLWIDRVRGQWMRGAGADDGADAPGKPAR